MYYKVVARIVENDKVIELVNGMGNDTLMEEHITERKDNGSVMDMDLFISFSNHDRVENLRTRVKFEQRKDIYGRRVYYEDYMRSASLYSEKYHIHLKDGQVKLIHRRPGITIIDHSKISMIEMFDIARLSNTYEEYFKTTRFFSGKTLIDEYRERLEKIRDGK